MGRTRGRRNQQKQQAPQPSTASGSAATGRNQAQVGATLRTASAPKKLNMVAGYTEALNWSSDAKALIDAHAKLSRRVGELEELRPQLTGKTFRHRRKQIANLRAFLTNLEQQRIPNDKGVREQHTQSIEAMQQQAETTHEAILTRLGQRATPEKEDELDAPDAENDVVESRELGKHEYERPLLGGEAQATTETSAPAPSSNSTATDNRTTTGNSTATATSTPTVLGNLTGPHGNSTAPIDHGNSTATGNSTAAASGNTTATGDESASATDDEDNRGTATKAIQALEFKILEVEKGKLFEDRAGRAGQASSEYGGGLKVTGGEGAQGELKAKLKVVLGKGHEQTSDPLDLVAMASGHKVQVRAKAEGMVGAKVEGGVEGSLSANREGVSGSLKGSASAFLGGSIEIAPQVRFVDAQGAPLATVTGIGGVTYGIGGGYEGSLAFDGWSLKFSSKGKLSAGLGVAWGMAGEIDAGALSSKLYRTIVG